MPAGSIPADVYAAIARLRSAMAMVANGDVSGITALYSHADDVTSFYGWGGYEKGWVDVARRWDWAGQQFRGGKISYETVGVVVTQDMFLTTDIETYSDQHMAGLDERTGWTNRVTHVFRREDDEWRLVHRHANRLEQQFTPSARLKSAGG